MQQKGRYLVNTRLFSSGKLIGYRMIFFTFIVASS